MITVHGYNKGCPACDKLKLLLRTHDIPFKFIAYKQFEHPFKSVPQVFNPGGSYVGDYNTIKGELEAHFD